jgi:hypothetical protein
MPAKKVFHLRCPVIAVLQSDDFWRSSASFGEVEKIGISENVDGIREKFRKAAYELRREICVKEKLQRDRRSRPVCEA